MNVRRLGVGAVLLVLGLTTAVLATSGSDPGVQRSLLMVSGRDDHGLVELTDVSLLSEPEGRSVSTVPDGALVQVLDVDGTWHRVRARDGAATGWVDDYRLRGTVHLVGGGAQCRPRLGGQLLAAGEQAELVRAVRGGVLVRLLRTPDVGGVVPTAALRQSPPRAPGACADVPQYATDGHVHVH